MRALVIGQGSIGVRHARILAELGCDVSVVSRRGPESGVCFLTLAAAVRSSAPEYVVIANRTSEHTAALRELEGLDYRGTVLIEKPVSHEPLGGFRPACSPVFVGYNLRFHPAVQRLVHLLEGERILSAQAYVGQYLPTWRPGSDYRESYSAARAQGGGVLRDLSHELDLLNWMLGGWRSLTAVGGHLSRLAGDSEDVCALLLTMTRCPVVSLQMNYLDRATHREVLLNTDAHTFRLDLVRGCLEIDGCEESHATERDATYRAEHEVALGRRTGPLCSLAEGLEVLEMIAAAELSMLRGIWVQR